MLQFVRRIAMAMNTNSTFTGSYTRNPFWYLQIDVRNIRTIRGGQPIVHFDAAEKCRLYVTTTKAMKFQNYIPSILIDNFKEHYVLVFDLTSMQDVTENCHYPELVGEPLRLEINFTFCSRTCYWTHCIGRTNVFGCSWQLWCSWKMHLKWIKNLFSK